jgi:hypothetical protein
VDLRRLAFVTVVALSSECATPAPPPAVVAHPAESAKAPADLIEDEGPVGYVPNARADTPQCRALFADFNKTWDEARTCERDADCAITIGNCTAARAEFKPALERKLQATAPCVDMIAISRCFDTRAICFETRCRVRGQVDKAD